MGDVAMRMLFTFLAWFALPVFAEVAEIDELGFVSRHVLEIDASPTRVFEALTDDIADWWDPAHTYSGDADNVQLSRTCLCEDLADGGFVFHMRVDYWRPGTALRLNGGLGPLQKLGASGSMVFDLESADTGTKLNYRYTVNGRGTKDMAQAVDRVQLAQLQRLARYVETGSPLPGEGSETGDQQSAPTDKRKTP